MSEGALVGVESVVPAQEMVLDGGEAEATFPPPPAIGARPSDVPRSSALEGRPTI